MLSDREAAGLNVPATAVQTQSALPREPRRLTAPAADVRPNAIWQPVRLSIPQIAVCESVWAYGEFTELDPRRLAAGQTVLLYVALADFRSHAGAGGYRTQTRSTLEIRSQSSQQVVWQAVAEATDVSRVPRHEYFLTHEVAIPADLSVGEYTLSVQIDDLLSGQQARAETPIRIHGGS